MLLWLEVGFNGGILIMDYFLVFNNEMVGSRVIISDKILNRNTHQYRELNGKKGLEDKNISKIENKWLKNE